MRVALLLLVSGVAWADKPCPKLESIGKLYDGYAADLAAAPGIESSAELDLPQIDGKPETISAADVVVVGAMGYQIYAGGEREHTDEAWTKHAERLVLAPEKKATYAQIRKALLIAQRLGYAQIAIGYRAFGVLHNRPVVETPDATRKQLNLAAWGLALHKQLVEHCPSLVEIFERDPMAASTVAAAAPLVRGCSCEIDTRYLEQWPLLIGEQLVTTVPLVAKAPAPQPSQRWADLVKGKPVPLALPELAAPPPPPPPPHR